MSNKKMDYRDLPKWKQPKVHKDHAPPRTRREFLAQGFISFAGTAVVPGLLTSIASRAYGVECSSSQNGSTNLPFVVVDLAGGSNIAYGNVLVGKNGSQSNFIDDAGAQLLGCPPGQNPLNNPQMVNSELKLLFHTNSAFLAGFKSSTSADTRKNMDGVVYAVRSADDSRNNPLNPIFFVNAAGAKGQLVDVAGTGASVALGKSIAPATSLSTASTVLVERPEDAASIVNPGLMGELLPGQAEKILKAAESMSAKRLAAFEAKTLPQQVQDLVNCGYISSVKNLTSLTPETIDPRNDQAVTTALAMNNIGTDATINPAFAPAEAPGQFVGEQGAAATLAKLVIDGYAGAATLELGGYDYHGDGRQAQSIMDFNAGRNAGFFFEIAKLKSKPMVMTFITDGAVSSRGGNPDPSPEAAGRFSFSSDSGVHSSAFMLVYNPNGVDSTGIRQIGSFLDGSGSVDQTTAIGNNIEAFTKAVTLNYLALKGDEGSFDKVVKGNPFGADTSKYISFGKLK
ncbi:MAG: hypothetical protein AB7T49_05740 [Oligoflexales bacterium]